jgi:hypothetical protein
MVRLTMFDSVKGLIDRWRAREFLIYHQQSVVCPEEICARELEALLPALEQGARAGEAAALRLVADYCGGFNQPPNISIAAASIKRHVEGLISPDAGRALDEKVAAAVLAESEWWAKFGGQPCTESDMTTMMDRLAANRQAAGGSHASKD